MASGREGSSPSLRTIISQQDHIAAAVAQLVDRIGLKIRALKKGESSNLSGRTTVTFNHKLQETNMELSFRCRVCNEMRPNDQISVKSLDTSKKFNAQPGTIKQNFNYCNDRTSCTTAAEKWDGRP